MPTAAARSDSTGVALMSAGREGICAGGTCTARALQLMASWKKEYEESSFVMSGTQPSMIAISARWPYEPILPSGTAHREACRVISDASIGFSTCHGCTEMRTDSVCTIVKSRLREAFFQHE